MVTVIVSHKVKDFKEWKKGFDADGSRRDSAGVRTTGIYGALDNPNDVTVVMEFPSPEVFKGLMGDPKMKEIMAAAGVISEPEIKVLSRT